VYVLTVTDCISRLVTPMPSYRSGAEMHITTQQEEFSYAFVDAIVAAAGYSVHSKKPGMDNAGIDIGVEVPGQLGRVLSPKFDAQVKCTSDDSYIKETQINYPLKVKNYKRLIHLEPSVPQLLILVFVPKDPCDWLRATKDEMVIRKSAYWISLKGRPDTKNTGNITVHIPRENLLTPDSLKEIMKRIAGKEL
jgi:hypothetical protein